MRKGGDADGEKFIHLVSTRRRNNPRRLRLPAVTAILIRDRFSRAHIHLDVPPRAPAFFKPHFPRYIKTNS